MKYNAKCKDNYGHDIQIEQRRSFARLGSIERSRQLFLHCRHGLTLLVQALVDLIEDVR